MKTTIKTNLERLIAMCEDYKIDINKCYSISIDEHQIKLQMFYNGDFMRDMKDRFEWRLETDYGFTIGEGIYDSTSIRITLT